MFHLISYPLNSKGAVWPGSQKIECTVNSSMARGDVCNTFMLHINNHFGTHFDAPGHFVDGGIKVASLPLERFIFERPLLIDIPKERCEKIQREELQSHAKEIMSCDLLLIRTGFSKYREDDREAYEKKGPAVGSDAAKYLIDSFPHLKAVALDFLSLASYSDTVDGNLAHQYILGKYNDHFICIIEDTDLRMLPSTGIKQVIALPLFADDLDSSPVTVIAEY